MEWRKRLMVGACLCAVGLGVVAEVAHAAHASYCPMAYRRDVIVCGTLSEAVVPEHAHGPEGGTPVFSRVTVATDDGSGTRERRLYDTVTLSDGRRVTWRV